MWRQSCQWDVLLESGDCPSLLIASLGLGAAPGIKEVLRNLAPPPPRYLLARRKDLLFPQQAVQSDPSVALHLLSICGFLCQEQSSLFSSWWAQPHLFGPPKEHHLYKHPSLHPWLPNPCLSIPIHLQGTSIPPSSLLMLPLTPSLT